MSKVLARFNEYLRSNKFYRLILIVFVIEASWIALSAKYPQAFDENFHFGLIKIYAHYWLPFLTTQPPHADAYGAVARDPSYLYHYLMSFPYRLINLFVKGQTVQVIILRFINIGFFAFGLVLFRKILLKVGTSKALTNLILTLFIFIPIVPQLAGQISYDNLLFSLTAAMILFGFKVMDEIKSRRASILSITLFLGSGLLVSLVKYAFLPIFAGLLLFLIGVAYHYNHKKLKNFFSQLIKNWHRQSNFVKLGLVLAFMVPLGMFCQRDLVNLVAYHSIEPNCSEVLSVKSCMAYSPWAYNYKKHAELIAKGGSSILGNPIVYPFQWLYWMWYRLFFAVNGPESHFKNYPPLPLPSAAALVLIVGGIAALIRWRRKLFKGNLRLKLLLTVTATYLIALMGQGYYTYRYTDVLENMNGRYLIPIMLFGAVMCAQAISLTLRRQQNRKVVFAVMALFLFLEGGGVFTFILRSNASWDINNKTVVTINNTARKAVQLVVVSGPKSYSSKLWFFN
jgi:hypothetical protein